MNTELENTDLTSNDAKPMLAEVIIMTAVDFLFKEMNKIRVNIESNILSAPELFERQNSVYEKAKELEREQHGRTWDKAIDNFEKRSFLKVRAICDFDEHEIK